MTSSYATRAPLSAAALLLLQTAVAPGAHAQEQPFNAAALGTFDQAGQSYADVWGEGDLAFLAHFGQNRVDIVDVSDAANPTLLSTYVSDVNASAQDVKSANGLMFVGLEGGTPGTQIVDVRDPNNPVKLTDITVRNNVHNLFYDQGWLYICDSSRPEVDVVDLRNYDPDNAPATINTQQWEITGAGFFVHDITASNGKLYVSSWDTIRVYDISNLDFLPPILLGTAPGNSVHAAWPTDDGEYLVVTEERSGGGATLYEVIDDGDSVILILRDTFDISTTRTSSAHNPLIVGDRVYISWYEAGLQVLEINRTSKTWDLIASYDTTSLDGTNSFFGGAWGVYPYLGEDKILVSDSGTGLWTISVNPNVLQFSYPNGQPDLVPPNAMTTVTTQVSEIGAPLDPSTVTLFTSVNGGPFTGAPMTDVGGGEFEGDLPMASCGSFVEWYVSAENDLGGVFRDPPTAPDGSFRADVATGTVNIFEDTFQFDMGWSVQNIAVDTGAWERGNPNGSGAQPEDDWPGDIDSSCYFTDQGPVGGGQGDNDVDGGPTILFSPLFDFSSGDGRISYSYWMFNDDGDDSLLVEVSNDGTNWFEARRYTGGSGGWNEDSFNVGDFVSPNSTVSIRMTVSDNPNNSVTEAAVDFVRGEVFTCDESSLVLDASDFERGQSATMTATGAVPGETVLFAVSTTGTGSGPCFGQLGGLCIDILPPITQLGGAVADGSGTATLTFTVPASAPLSEVGAQAVVERGPGGDDSVKSNTVTRTVLP